VSRLNFVSSIDHRPGISSLPILIAHSASPFSSQSRHDASPMGIGFKSASRTPIALASCYS
jgi:hypothetical protein